MAFLGAESFYYKLLILLVKKRLKSIMPSGLCFFEQILLLDLKL